MLVRNIIYSFTQSFTESFTEKLRHELRHPGLALDLKTKDLIGHL